MDITVLGSSSAGNCYVVDDRETSLLLECGLRFADIRKGVGFRVSGLAGALLTHEHADHARSVRDVMKAGVDAYTSTGTIEALELLGHHRVHMVQSMRQFTVGTWTVLPFDAVHDAAEPLNYLLASGGEKLCYITDSAYCKYRFDGITRLLVECNHSVSILRENVANGSLDPGLKNRILRSHMSLETLLKFLRANDMSRVQQITLIHVSDANGDEAGFKLAVQRATGKMVCVAPARGVI